jgi:hypothetical protein
MFGEVAGALELLLAKIARVGFRLRVLLTSSHGSQSVFFAGIDRRSLRSCCGASFVFYDWLSGGQRYELAFSCPMDELSLLPVVTQAAGDEDR